MCWHSGGSGGCSTNNFVQSRIQALCDPCHRICSLSHLQQHHPHPAVSAQEPISLFWVLLSSLLTALSHIHLSLSWYHTAGSLTQPLPQNKDSSIPTTLLNLKLAIEDAYFIMRELQSKRAFPFNSPTVFSSGRHNPMPFMQNLPLFVIHINTPLSILHAK